jgi:cytochrome c-type biogenesis protein CcmF|tara:strand:- start:4967 stop:6862 length:1896 start_codon:yes stop_codon:yes gene_type:complete
MLVEIAQFLTILSTGLFFLNFSFSFLFDSKDQHIANLVSKIYTHSSLLLVTSFLIYVWLAVSDNFSVLYIAQHSNSNLPTFYKITSIWSAHEGSMFLWILFLVLWGALFNFVTDNLQDLKVKSMGIISIIIVGFLLFLLLTSNPFETILPIAPANGADINPVLQDPALAIHPPFLYIGYIGFVIAFAHAIAFMIEGNSSVKWEALVRTWSIAAWVFLTIGITLGSWWAYYELGWGGYWFWDPVENVALMPWLAATAFIHSISVSSKSSSLRIWTILLSIIVFSLSLFGAFIVRSGIIDSVHSFANDPERGLYLLAFIGILIIGSMTIFSSRLSMLTSGSAIKTFSKESFISINNIFFGVLVFSTMLGILYPLIYESIYEQKISVGAPFYNAIFVPMAVLASIFLFFSVEARWQRKFVIRSLINSMSISALISGSLVFSAYKIFNITGTWELISIFAGSLIIIRYLFVIWDYLLNNKYSNPFSVIAHMGLGMLMISIALNNELSSERALNININQSDMYQGYEIKLSDLKLVNNPNHDSVQAIFTLTDPLGNNFYLKPEKRKYFARGQITTETDIYVTLLKDIYITIGDQLKDGSWIVNIQFNYFIRWIWFSAIMMSFSGIMLIVSINRAKR